MCRLISPGIVLTKQVSVKSEVSSKTKRVCVAVCMFFLCFLCFFFFFFCSSLHSCEAYVSHQRSVTVEVTSEPWRACTAREAF